MRTQREQANAFGRWLDTTMANRSISARRLATKVGVSDAAVSRWRSGLAVPAMDNCARLADVLGVDPLQLAVTAGLLSSDVAHVEPLPIPAPTALRQHVIEQIGGIKGLTDETRASMLAAFDRNTEEENEQG